MSDIEIERKYLLLPCRGKRVLELFGIAYKKERLEQFYVSTEASPYTRYRKKGDTYYQTIKSGEGLVRQEKEREVSSKEYKRYKHQSLGRIITKDRYTFEYQGSLYEMDIFKGTLKGLCYLEIEFHNEEEANTFTLPGIFEKLIVAEVTFDTSFNNSALSNSETYPTPTLKYPALKEKKSLSEITPFLPLDQALNTMIYLLVEEIKEYQETLIKDPKEVETLHQFRVTMRKLRALLQEFEPFFDPVWVKSHKKTLAGLMEETNAKRDNDVALIDIDSFKEQLSSKDQQSLDTLKSSLDGKEKKLKKKLITFMSSKMLSEELEILSRSSQNSNQYLDTAKQPLILVAINVIDNRIKEIISEGRDLKKDTDKKAYHKLRIQFKKLRYLFELLSPVIEVSKLENALNHLKKIQTVLGEINDLEIQQKELDTFCQTSQHQKQTSFRTLQKQMKRKETKRMKTFKKAFKTFKEEKSLFKRLLFIEV
jgi:CHAD domain-containing protein/CYTH domain-containing protein